jgi:hypothetical protein
MGKASRKKREFRESSAPRLPDYLANLAETTDLKVRTNLPDEQKISSRLLSLLNIMVPEESPLDVQKNALGLVVIAWNLSGYEEAERETMLDELIGDFFKEAVKAGETKTIKTMLKLLIDRKLEMFPLDKRTVVSWKISFKGKKLFVTAAAINPGESKI